MGELPLQPIGQEALRDRVVDAIRDAVIQGRLRPGEKVPEDDLAATLGVSRTPVREAIRILEQQGLVVVRPKRGTYVAVVNRGDESDGLMVRSMVEELAVRQAVSRLDDSSWKVFVERLEGHLAGMATAIAAGDLVRATELDIEFHTDLIRTSANRYLARTWHVVGIPFLIWAPEREIYGNPSPAWVEHFVERHVQLVEAIRTRDPETAALAVRTHIGRKVAELDEEPGDRS